MITERYMPLAKAAKIVGVSPQTLRRWLEKDHGLVFPQARFQRTLVSESLLQQVIDARTGKPNWSRKSRVA